MTMLRRAWAHSPLATVIGVLAIVFAVLFAVRLALFTFYWADPANRRHAPEGWMTPGFIAHSWHVPKPDVIRAVGGDQHPDHPMTLSEIAEARGVSEPQLLSDLAEWLETAAPHE